jgi:general L-amino acid transport system permease protein
VATTAIVLMLAATAWPGLWTRRGARALAAGWAAAFIVFFGLMFGGVAGLTRVGTELWGGLPLTVILTLIGMTASAPLGIALALGAARGCHWCGRCRWPTSNWCAACR